MLWDVLIVFAALGLGIAGWNVGLINSWRGPFALVLATVVTQMFYVDFATWIVQQLSVKPAYAVLFAYLMMWLVIEICTELAMNLFLSWNRKERPRALDRVGGVIFALVKCLCICLFPVVAFASPGKVPEAPVPPSDTQMINPIKLGVEDSRLFKILADVGGSLPFVKSIVVSDKAPSFKPNFENRAPVGEKAKGQLDRIEP
ncbi:MAG: CvpA family protein [Candidatus Obscuribacterales bacterium]|nr:CvpA family protein [Candidatus Obscuribacterales bacterium]